VGARRSWYHTNPRRSPIARKTDNDEFKTQAARLVTEQGYTIKQAAQNLGVDQGSSRHWVRKFAAISSPLAPNATAEQLQRENQRLREENRRLLMEREILKKAATFFAKESS
jgi:transposase